MLTDIFATRYAAAGLWETLEEQHRRLLVQSFRVLTEQVCPYYENGKPSERGIAFWGDIHSRLSMELGLMSLGPTFYSYPARGLGGQTVMQTAAIPVIKICEDWMTGPLDGAGSADRHVKERLSLVELGFRRREEEIAKANAGLQTEIAKARLQAARRGRVRVPGDAADGVRAKNAGVNAEFKAAVEELNTRFRQAGVPLQYHNGFIQVSDDALVTAQIEKPFWELVADPKWKNVDTDIKEAIDRRDNGTRNASKHAADALESALKIVSDEKGLSHGKENGPHSYIDNLASRKSGFLAPWEGEMLKQFFTKVRHPQAHGPGKSEMFNLSPQQTDWAIETCITWIKSIIRRL